MLLTANELTNAEDDDMLETFRVLIDAAAVDIDLASILTVLTKPVMGFVWRVEAVIAPVLIVLKAGLGLYGLTCWPLMLLTPNALTYPSMDDIEERYVMTELTFIIVLLALPPKYMLWPGMIVFPRPAVAHTKVSLAVLDKTWPTVPVSPCESTIPLVAITLKE